MQFTNAIFAALLLFGTAVQALPSESNQTKWDFSQAQRYKVASDNGLERRTEMPAACDFPIGKALYDNLWYLSASDSTGGTACLGWIRNSVCNSAFAADEITSMGSAMSQQITKDGAFQETKVDSWTASFIDPPTTAFSVRDSDEWSQVVEGLQDQRTNSKYWSYIYYWGVDNDGQNYASVETSLC